MKGFTLLELLLATTILLVVFLFAGQSLLESQRMTIRTAEELVNPSAELALAQLRFDLQSASRTEETTALWSRDDLILDRPAGDRLAYRRQGEELERLVIDEQGKVLGRRVLLQEVVRFVWRAPLPNLVDVEIATRVRTPPRGFALLAVRRRGPSEGWHTDSLRVALRGGGGRGW